MNFVDNHVKVKSNWFDSQGVFSKIGSDAFLLYLTLYKFHLYNQDTCMFATSMKMLKKETGFTINKTFDLFKVLIRYKVIECSVTRWDRYEDNEFMFVTALDTPKTIRKTSDKGKEYDEPLSADDNYISCDMKMMQYYLDNGLSGAEMGLYCLIRKWSNGTQRQMWMSINKMADHLGLSNDKVHKMIYKLNRMFLMYSNYQKNGTRTINGKKVTSYRFYHTLFAQFSHLDTYRKQFNIEIEKNIAKWDKVKDSKAKSKAKQEQNPFINGVEDDDFVVEEQESEQRFNYEEEESASSF